MKKKFAFVILAALVAAAATHWYFSDRGRFTTEPRQTGLTRQVDGNALISEQDPAAVLRFSPEYRYLGGHKFILFGVADTEQHFFVETTPDNKLTSIYWVQYEAYLPDKPYAYDYADSPLRVQIGDYEFFTDTTVFHYDPDRKRRRGTDGEMVRRFLAGKGYQYPEEVVYARLVYLTDASRRKELMIIFMDDLAQYGFTAEALGEGGETQDRWPEVEKAHLDKVRATLTMHGLAPGS